VNRKGANKVEDILYEPVELIDQDLDAVVGGNNIVIGVVIGEALGAFSEQENTIAQVNAVVATNFLNG
jgi:hypothetical protein